MGVGRRWRLTQQALRRAHGAAALIVTHDLDEARYVSDPVLLLNAAGPHRAGRLLRDVAVTGRHPRDRRDETLAACVMSCSTESGLWRTAGYKEYSERIQRPGARPD
ncbi:hypothetical protein [Paraburkholderia sp. RAU2J]|uniref:hypothetical protein n=1 Tax=Paraburkholderia sp. RAU2J TaxID=1938810 RepID=UPI000EAEC2A9|nr:hypothetical protein [Paraburkholderia sp. RAU2J]